MTSTQMPHNGSIDSKALGQVVPPAVENALAKMRAAKPRMASQWFSGSSSQPDDRFVVLEERVTQLENSMRRIKSTQLPQLPEASLAKPHVFERAARRTYSGTVVVMLTFIKYVGMVGLGYGLFLLLSSALHADLVVGNLMTLGQNGWQLFGVALLMGGSVTVLKESMR